MEALEKLEHMDHNREAVNTEIQVLGLHSEQADLMISAIEFGHKKAVELMIPLVNCFMIDYEEVLDTFKLGLILDKGFSRIPCHAKNNRNDVLGILRIKQLIGIDISQNKSIRQLGIKLSSALIMRPDSTAIELLREFKKGRSHMAFVTEQADEINQRAARDKISAIDLMNLRGSKKPLIMGIVTLEDVIEKMINIEIMDEEDYARESRTKPSRYDSSYYSKPES